ncbi:uncharacterized protein LOC130825969 isoform X2 [Amaranthus tricolor]|uniref:uncharacterized protein LOC130825969 isoform X2 n=1 Tax=Amaranthus tricolor TaxID=29722 RepID=UPI002587762D|nr:uncharacterized protein LOC130825969 isoform X2 [Amaranthus tricolor]
MPISLHLQFPFFVSSEFRRHRSILIPKLSLPLRPLLPSANFRVFTSNLGKLHTQNSKLCCFCKTNLQVDKVDAVEVIDRPPFDINLAVILAGFAFEAYTTPPDNVGRREVDAAGCMTVYLSESFVREIYDGQMCIQLKKGFDFPAMDPWGTSDPYVVIEYDGQVVKSKTKWGTKDPTWNEEFNINIKLPPNAMLQVAAWDANLVTPHKRMGNAGFDLNALCDGDAHELLVELEGMGGGGKLQFEVKYRSFGEIDEDRKWWKIPFVSEFFSNNGFDSAVKMLSGSESVPVSEFVQNTFSQLKSLNDSYLQKDQRPSTIKLEIDDGFNDSSVDSDASLSTINSSEGSSNDPKLNEGIDENECSSNDTSDTTQSNMQFWKSFADVISQNLVQKLGIPVPEKMKWDAFDVIKNIGFQSQQVAEAGYIESGLATPEKDPNNDSAAEPSPLNISKLQSTLPDLKKVTEDILKQTDYFGFQSQWVAEDGNIEPEVAMPEKEPNNNSGTESSSLSISKIQVSLPDIRKATDDILKQTDSIFSALMVLSAAGSQSKKESLNGEHSDNIEDSSSKDDGDVVTYMRSDELAELNETRAQEMRALFSTAESAMEAWAMLASALGKPSLIRSEFEKICFLDNSTTDTQVAIWRDSTRKRLVVAFRGTEQSRWKDLRTDLMLAPAGLNPERIGGDFKEEVQVHSGFLSAYDSVRTRIMSLIKKAIDFIDDAEQSHPKWQIYCTGHSLGGALATLLALELSSTQLAKSGAISVTMYNFGSPRVGNKRFAQVYNERVRDSWRVVNHRDIIPTVPRLMGYCHVAQPVYLAAGTQGSSQENVKLSEDGYQGDVIGEATPDVLVNEFSIPWLVCIRRHPHLVTTPSVAHWNMPNIEPLSSACHLVDNVLKLPLIC